MPSIYVIHPGVGCIAPDSIFVGFGVMSWLARNGVYVWDGNDPPRRVSDHTSFTFGKMSQEKYGGSRCLLHNRMYETYLIDNNATELATARFRHDLVTDSWAQRAFGTGFSGRIAPLCVVTAPLGHADVGVRHPLYGQTDKSGTDYAIYLGEMTTQDAGNNYTCSATVHFGPMGLSEYTVDSVFAYYDKDSGWATPTLAPGSASVIGGAIGTITNMTPDGAADYTRLKGIPAEGVFGTGDVTIVFSATSASGGTVNSQRLLSVGLEGQGTTSMWGKS